jgi:hypothetical protein
MTDARGNLSGVSESFEFTLKRLTESRVNLVLAALGRFVFQARKF